MNDRNYRKYSQEFKLEALELLQRGDKSAGQIERELGITPGLVVKGLPARAEYLFEAAKHRYNIINGELPSIFPV
jgi:transposase-like protein